jgi:hypothetical protein
MFARKILLLLSKCISIDHAGFNYSDYIWTFGSIYLSFKFSEVQTRDNFNIETQRKLMDYSANGKLSHKCCNSSRVS